MWELDEDQVRIMIQQSRSGENTKVKQKIQKILEHRLLLMLSLKELIDLWASFSKDNETVSAGEFQKRIEMLIETMAELSQFDVDGEVWCGGLSLLSKCGVLLLNV